MLVTLDYVCLGIIALSVIVSFFRGFAKEMVSLIAWITGSILAFTYAPQVQSMFSGWIGSHAVRFVMAFILILFVVLLLGCLLNKLIGFCIKHVGLSFFDRFIGVLFGLVRGIFVVIVISLFVSSLQWQQKSWIKNSVMMDNVQPVAMWVSEMLPEQDFDLHDWVGHSSDAVTKHLLDHKKSK